MTKLLSLYILLFFACVSFAQNPPQKYAIYFGGGDGTENRFVGSFAEFLGLEDWNREYFYNGANPTIGENRFNKKTFTTSIEQYIQKIEKGEIKKGDQLLVQIDTHGTVDPTTGQYIVVADGDERLSIEKTLQKLKAIAVRNGIKLAILGSTCYSGHLQKLGDDQVCVVSSSQPDKVAYNLQVLGFRGSSLENAFLEARKKQILPAQAMISTDAGKKIESKISMLKPIFITFDDANNCATCARLTSSNIKGILKTAEISLHASAEVLSTTTQLETDLTTYEQVYNIAKNQKYFCVNTNGGFFCYLASYDVDEEIERIDMELKTQRNPRVVDRLHEIRTALEEHKSAQVYKERTNDFVTYHQTQKRIIEKERILYNSLYQKLNDPKKPNPCRDFKL